MATHPWKLPEKVDLGDITVRDGLQALEHYFPTDVKVRLAEDLILAGYRHVEVTNFGNPKFLPQFRDAEDVLDRLFGSERVGRLLKQNGGEVTVTIITISERAVERALEYKAKRGFGPDYVLQMVSTDPHHHKVNSGSTLEDYWRMTERATANAKAQGVGMCGTVSTIWGSPMRDSRATTMETAVEFSKRYLDLGADYIEQADHDGSADPARVFEYFSMILDPARMGKWADPRYHLAHFHTTRGMGLSNYLAALQAGIVRFETTLCGVGGQPANALDGVWTGGTGAYYHKEHLASGLVGTEDFVVMLEAMGVKTGLDIPKLLATGRMFRDEGLAIRPEDQKQLISNLARTTGLPEERIAKLRDSDQGIEEMIAEGAGHYAQAQGKTKEAAVAVVGSLLGTGRFYLRWGHWALPRAETLAAGVPPSPHLRHLVDG